MLKYLAMAAAAAGLAALLPASPAMAALGPDADACRTGSGQAAVLVDVSGLKARTGRLRVQLYGANPGDFLAKGKKLRRIDLAVPAKGAVPVCVAVPRPGRYAIAVRHDVNGNDRSGDWSDGGGFSRNPRLSLFRLKPRHRDAAIDVGAGVTPIRIVLNYRRGLSIGPVRQAA